MNICRNCRWSRPHWLLGFSAARCVSPKTQPIIVDLVTGREERRRAISCTEQRNWESPVEFESICGEDGRYWEALS